MPTRSENVSTQHTNVPSSIIPKSKCANIHVASEWINKGTSKRWSKRAVKGSDFLALAGHGRTSDSHAVLSQTGHQGSIPCRVQNREIQTGSSSEGPGLEVGSGHSWGRAAFQGDEVLQLRGGGGGTVQHWKHVVPLHACLRESYGTRAVTQLGRV